MENRLIEIQAEEWMELARKVEQAVKIAPHEDVKTELRISARTWRKAATQLQTLLNRQARIEVQRAQGAAETGNPKRLIDLPYDPATRADVEFLREDVAELAEAIGQMQRTQAAAQGPRRAHRRTSARRHFRKITKRAGQYL